MTSSASTKTARGTAPRTSAVPSQDPGLELDGSSAAEVSAEKLRAEDPGTKANEFLELKSDAQAPLSGLLMSKKDSKAASAAPRPSNDMDSTTDDEVVAGGPHDVSFVRDDNDSSSQAVEAALMRYVGGTLQGNVDKERKNEFTHYDMNFDPTWDKYLNDEIAESTANNGATANPSAAQEEAQSEYSLFSRSRGFPSNRPADSDRKHRLGGPSGQRRGHEDEYEDHQVKGSSRHQDPQSSMFKRKKRLHNEKTGRSSSNNVDPELANIDGSAIRGSEEDMVESAVLRASIAGLEASHANASDQITSHTLPIPHSHHQLQSLNQSQNPQAHQPMPVLPSGKVSRQRPRHLADGGPQAYDPPASVAEAAAAEELMNRDQILALQVGSSGGTGHNHQQHHHHHAEGHRRLDSHDLLNKKLDRISWTGDGSEVGGSFTKEESEKINEFLTQYSEFHNLTRAQLCERVWAQERKRDKFWDDVSAVLPSRTRASIYKHVRRAYHVFNTRGKWLPEEDQMLDEQVKQRGNQWKAIGLVMGRMPEDCRDRWRNYVKCGNNRVQNKWNEKEEEELMGVVLHIMESDPNGEVNWTTVSEMMGGKRSRIQCRYKWNKMNQKGQVVLDDMRAHLSNTRDNANDQAASMKESAGSSKAGGGKGKMTWNERMKLLNRLKESSYQEEGQVDWDSLAHELFQRGKTLVYNGHDLYDAWSGMRENISNSQDKSFIHLVYDMMSQVNMEPRRSKHHDDRADDLIPRWTS